MQKRLNITAVGTFYSNINLSRRNKKSIGKEKYASICRQNIKLFIL